jgi:signal transduction histidine kinase
MSDPTFKEILKEQEMKNEKVVAYVRFFLSLTGILEVLAFFNIISVMVKPQGPTILVSVVLFLYATAVLVILSRNIYRKYLKFFIIFLDYLYVVMSFLLDPSLSNEALNIKWLAFAAAVVFYLVNLLRYSKSGTIYAGVLSLIVFNGINLYFHTAFSDYLNINLALCIILYIGYSVTISNKKMIDNFTKHHLQEQELRVSKEAAEIASKSKSKFLANMSHELRTPLNSVIAASDILLEKYFGDLTEKQEEYLKDVNESGHHLLSLINDILDLSKVEAGHSPLELEEVDLNALLKRSLVIVQEKALKHNIQLSCTVSENIPFIKADERRIKQIIYNLLSNAVKFTEDGGKVGIEANIEKSVVKICVWDTGIGISEKDKSNIFGEYAQAEDTLTKKYEGTGLGLALVKRLVEEHGGCVWLDSDVGKGSQFYLTLPMEPKVHNESLIKQ